MKWVALVFALVTPFAYGDDGASDTAKSYVENFPSQVLALSKCDLVKLMCGRETLKVTVEMPSDKDGKVPVFKKVSGNGIEIWYTFPKNRPQDYRVGFLIITGSNIKMPMGLVIGDTVKKAEKLLGPGKWDSDMGSLYYVNEEQISHVQFIVENGRIIETRWEIYQD